MALRRRGETWYADYYAAGERVVESTGTANRREAEKFLSLRISEVQRRVFVRPVNTTLTEFGERYIEHAKLHKRSWKRDIQLLTNLKAFFGPIRLRDITAAKVERYQKERVASVAPATANRETALLKHMINLAEQWGEHHGANPVRVVGFLPEDNIQFETLDEKEEAALCLASPPYLREMIVFALNTGFRSSDIFNLGWTEVDIEQKRLLRKVKKNSKFLSLPLNDAAHAVLRARAGHRDGPYVFVNPRTGDKFKNVRGALDAAIRRARIKKITWHMFRHTFATRLIRAGVDIVTVKELLGHANISTTLRYAHSNDEAKRRAVEKLSGTGNKTVTSIPRSLAG